MSSLLLNRTTAPHMVRFFDVCFKQGVEDACANGDELSTKEFLEEKSADWSFGVLGSGQEYDWEAFRYWLYFLARRRGMRTLAETYLFRIRTKNYIWCALVYCMRFYLMGIREWLRYQNPSAIEYFKTVPKVHWDPNEPIKKFTKPDYFSYLHEFEFAFRNVPKEEQIVSENAMTCFVQALFDLTREYVSVEAPDI